MHAPNVTAYANYNAQSRGLLGPLVAVGNCLRDERLDVDRAGWCDLSAPIYSGDTVDVFHADEGHLSVFGKIIQRTRGGRWHLLSWLTDKDDSLFAMPLDYLPFSQGIVAIAPVVLRIDTPRKVPRDASPAEQFSPALMRALKALSAPAEREWAQLGFPPRTRFDWNNDLATVRKLQAMHAKRKAS